MARKSKPATQKFTAQPGTGWAFPKSTIGPLNDQQIVITGMIPLTFDQNLFVDMRLPVAGGVLSVKIKDPTDWSLIASLEMAKPEFPNAPRKGSFKIGSRNYTLVVSNGTTQPKGDTPGRKCLRLRIPEIIPMPNL